jgi:hypothetical protein
MLHGAGLSISPAAIGDATPSDAGLTHHTDAASCRRADRHEGGGSLTMITFLSRRSSRPTGRAAALTDVQLARTVRAMAYNYVALDPYRAAVLEEAARRILHGRQP